MVIAFIDGLGGGLMAQVISNLPEHLKKKVELLALGTNSMAALAMVKAGAKNGASGEHAICYSIQQVDLLVAPLGLIIPNAMYGEVTPEIAQKVAGAVAKKIFLPIANINIKIVGLENKSMNQLIKETVSEITTFIEKES